MDSTDVKLTNLKLYKVWSSLKDRILNPKNKNYNNYGGRGITLCEEWKNNFKAFYYWAVSNGYLEGLSIDRIDNDGNYEPSNCRWSTRTIQNRNQRISKYNKSGFKGVSKSKGSNRYRSCIFAGKRIHLGYFDTAEEGAITYNNYIIENNLEGFILNEIPQKHLEKEITNE